MHASHCSLPRTGRPGHRGADLPSGVFAIRAGRRSGRRLEMLTRVWAQGRFPSLKFITYAYIFKCGSFSRRSVQLNMRRFSCSGGNTLSDSEQKCSITNHPRWRSLFIVYINTFSSFVVSFSHHLTYVRSTPYMYSCTAKSQTTSGSVPSITTLGKPMRSARALSL